LLLAYYPTRSYKRVLDGLIWGVGSVLVTWFGSGEHW
jgi:hypothetical protein